MKYVDLHLHSTASDGTCTPAELARCAAEAGLSAAAITDHDTIAGAEEFLRECEKLGLEAAAGVEISAKFRTEMHILGLFVDYNNEEFIENLHELKNARALRNRQMLEKLSGDGFKITAEDITGQKKDGSLDNVGRAHIAAALVHKGYVSSVQEGFDKYLSKGCKYYVPRKTYPPKESIELIKKAGGVAVLAHPIFITKDPAELHSLLSELKSYGLAGVESYYSEYTEDYTKLCLRLCRELGLMPSGGSDFHGGNKPHIHIGEVCGGRVDYEVFTGLKGLR